MSESQEGDQMHNVQGYKTPIWAQASMGLAGMGVLLALVAALAAFIGLQLGKFSESEAWLLVYSSVALFVWAVPLGALGALLAELRKHRLSWSQKNDVDSDIQIESE
jgi:hypothetical protein